jgi:hypothetical protein
VQLVQAPAERLLLHACVQQHVNEWTPFIIMQQKQDSPDCKCLAASHVQPLQSGYRLHHLHDCFEAQAAIL